MVFVLKTWNFFWFTWLWSISDQEGMQGGGGGGVIKRTDINIFWWKVKVCLHIASTYNEDV